MPARSGWRDQKRRLVRVLTASAPGLASAERWTATASTSDVVAALPAVVCHSVSWSKTEPTSCLAEREGGWAWSGWTGWTGRFLPTAFALSPTLPVYTAPGCPIGQTEVTTRAGPRGARPSLD